MVSMMSSLSLLYSFAQGIPSARCFFACILVSSALVCSSLARPSSRNHSQLAPALALPRPTHLFCHSRMQFLRSTACPFFFAISVLLQLSCHQLLLVFGLLFPYSFLCSLLFSTTFFIGFSSIFTSWGFDIQTASDAVS